MLPGCSWESVMNRYFFLISLFYFPAGTVDMGSKQSTVGEVSIVQTPVTESIQDAYKAGDTSKAQELIRLSCEETALQVEKVGVGY